MSEHIDIAELLNQSKQEETTSAEAAPDPKTDPNGALEFHRNSWPLNQKVADGDLPEKPEGSDRVRMRRASEELAECGLVLDGSFANNYYGRSGANFTVSANFGSDGNMWRNSFSVNMLDSGHLEDDEALAMVQQLLQQWGFPVVVSLQGGLNGCEVGSEEAVRWAETGLRPSYVGGSTTLPKPEEMLRYQSVLSGISTGVRGYSILDWASSKFSPEEATEWMENKVATVREAEAWETVKLAPSDAKEWIDAGWVHYQARDWIAGGYKAAQAAEWRGVVNDYAQARAWMDAGYKPEDVRPWTAFDRSSVPTKIQFLVDNGVDSKQMALLAEAGCSSHTLEALQKWTDRYKITFAEALEWAKLGPDFVGPGKRGRWNKAGFTPGEIRKWQVALGSRRITIDQVRAKQSAGFDPEQGAEWTAIHPDFSNSGLVATWTGEGLAPEDAKEWTALDSRFCDYEQVKEWVEAGLTPKQAKPWALEGFVSYTVVNDWQKASPKLENNPALVAKLSRLTTPDRLAEILVLMELED